MSFFSLNEDFSNSESVHYVESDGHEDKAIYEAKYDWQISGDDDAIFRATVSNMKPEQVFNHPRHSGSRSRSESLRSQESPTRRYSECVQLCVYYSYIIDPPGQGQQPLFLHQGCQRWGRLQILLKRVKTRKPSD